MPRFYTKPSCFKQYFFQFQVIPLVDTVAMMIISTIIPKVQEIIMILMVMMVVVMIIPILVILEL